MKKLSTEMFSSENLVLFLNPEGNTAFWNVFVRQDLRGGAFFRGKGVFFGAAGICFFVFLESSETADQTKGGQMKKLSTEGYLFLF